MSADEIKNAKFALMQWKENSLKHLVNANTLEGPLRDRYGLMSVEIGHEWKDVTDEFLNQVEAAQSFGRLQKDTGIQHLLSLKRSNTADCRFRELTYRLGEYSFGWILEKLNYEIANVRNQYMKYSNVEFIKLGIFPTVADSKANSTGLLTSGVTTYTLFNGWQHRYRHEFNGNSVGKVIADTWTISMRFAPDGASNKRYLIAECSLNGAEETVNAVEKLMASVKFDGEYRTQSTDSANQRSFK